MTEKCESCSKEKVNKVPIRRVIEKLDSCFSKNDLKGAGELLEYWINEGKKLNDTIGVLEILNEQIGFFRRINDKKQGMKAVEDALEIIESEKFLGTVSIGTIFINCATTLKAFGYPEKANPLYDKAEEIFSRFPETDSFRKAALYNNAASSYADLKQYEKSKEYYKKAIEILKKDNIYKGELAVSYVNLAHIYFELDPCSEKVNENLDVAWNYLTDETVTKDGNYAFVCSKCASSFGYFGQFLKEEYLKAEAEKIYEGT